MPWIRLEDHVDEHPKIAAASDGAFRLWVNALAYANRSLSDGFIPAPMIRRLSTAHKPEKDAAELVKLGLWETVDGGWLIHDFHDYQPSREQVLEERRKTAERVKNWRDRKKDAQSNAVTNPVSNPVGNGGVTDSPYPYPYPVPKKGSVANVETGKQHGKGAEGKAVAESSGADAREGQHFSSSFSGSKSARPLSEQEAKSAGNGQIANGQDERTCVPNQEDTEKLAWDDVWDDDESGAADAVAVAPARGFEKRPVPARQGDGDGWRWETSHDGSQYKVRTP